MTKTVLIFIISLLVRHILLYEVLATTVKLLDRNKKNIILEVPSKSGDSLKFRKNHKDRDWEKSMSN